MAKITIILEDKSEGTAIDFHGDLPVNYADAETNAQKLAAIINKTIHGIELFAANLEKPKTH